MILLLSLVMLSPGIFQFSHVFQDHDHVACNDYEVHIHQDIQDCDICHFHQTPFNYELITYSEIIKEEVTKQLVGDIIVPSFSIKLTNIQLRAPPSILG
ncbi:hypothetical protein [Christiangramia sp.]|uniref:hypothetical protein n=1 Tax=Christiangramia sp. TaxID=1931228 RepID=UPI00263850C2|nr:hypothetical protein [Christiangramia sp.]